MSSHVIIYVTQMSAYLFNKKAEIILDWGMVLAVGVILF